MNGREKTVAEIEHVLATETRATVLSNRLFTPQGLFSQLATTDSERRTLVESELFTRAQNRLSDLQEQEAEQEQAGDNVAAVPLMRSMLGMPTHDPSPAVR